MASLQHLRGLGCAEGTGQDSDVSGPGVGHHSAEAEGHLQDSQRTRGQFLQKPERPVLDLSPPTVHPSPCPGFVSDGPSRA